MTKTTNYALNKPDREDALNIDDLNENADIIDQSLKAAATAAGDAMPKAGGTFTGNVVAYGTNRTTASLRNIEVTDAAQANLVSTNLIRFVRQ